jgi:hypothetical protein
VRTHINRVFAFAQDVQKGGPMSIQFVRCTYNMNLSLTRNIKFLRSRGTFKTLGIQNFVVNVIGLWYTAYEEDIFMSCNWIDISS